jgi:surface antigen
MGGTNMKKATPHLRSSKFLSKLVLVAGIVVCTNVLATTDTSAKSSLFELKKTASFVKPLDDSEVKIAELRKKATEQRNRLKIKEENAKKALDEAKAVKDAQAEVEKRILDLGARLAEVEDMFVKINRYAPDAAGNAYAGGNCTWYVKSKRPDIGNFWGNANSWYASAAAQGWNVGSKAKVGAIGTTTEGWAGHVVYVEKVSRDGSRVTISEMNYGGALGVVHTRSVPASDFQYIYELN